VWFTVLLMALAISTEPFRLGMTVLMLNRPRPVAHLSAFLAGGFAMAIAMGMFVLFVLHSTVAKSANTALPLMQIGLGIAGLLVAVVLMSGVKIRQLEGGQRDQGTPSKLRSLLNREAPWLAGVAGVAIALPSVDYLAVLTVISASDQPPAAQIGALLMFNVIAFAFVEGPLACYLFAPERTRAVMDRLNQWMSDHRRWTLVIMLVVVSVILLVTGFVGLQI